jgi:hypothetical protein
MNLKINHLSKYRIFSYALLSSKPTYRRIQTPKQIVTYMNDIIMNDNALAGLFCSLVPWSTDEYSWYSSVRGGYYTMKRIYKMPKNES